MDEKFVEEKCPTLIPNISDILGFLKLPELTESKSMTDSNQHKIDKEIPLDSIDTNDFKLLIEKTKEETPLSTQVYPLELSTKEPNSSSEEIPSELSTETHSELSTENPLELSIKEPSSSSELTTELSNSESTNSSKELTTESSESSLESSNSSSEETSTTNPNSSVETSSEETSSENYSSDGSDTVEIPVKEYHENIDLDEGALGELTKQLMDLRINYASPKQSFSSARYEEEKNNQHGGMFLKPVYKLSKSKSRKSKSRNSKSKYRKSKSRNSKSKSRK